MALTRKFLKAMGIEDEKIDQIIEAHTETVSGLKDRLDKAESAMKDLPGIQKELETAKAELEAVKKDGWKDKHDILKKEFEDYKAGVEEKETKSAKEAAAKAYYQNKNITGAALDIAMKGSAEEIASLEICEDGKVKDYKPLDDLIAGTFKGLVSTTTITGANTATPPVTNGGGMNKADIYKKDDKGRYLMSASERQKALMENQIM